MLIRYVGPSKEVDIAATGQVAKRLQPLEVDGAVASELLKQSTWEKAPAQTTKNDKDKE